MLYVHFNVACDYHAVFGLIIVVDPKVFIFCNNVSFYHKPQACKSISQSSCINSSVINVVNCPAKGL